MSTADHLITTKAAADLLALTPRNAKALLLSHGLCPINVGLSRKRCDRWLASAVHALIQELHAQAQRRPQEKNREPEEKLPRLSILAMSLDDLYDLTRSRIIQ